MAVYLVDFENVHSEGLTGVEKLGENDECYIFYSVNACSLSFDLHQKIIESKAKFYYKMVDAHGKNALDFQLVTFLGYLVAKHPMSIFTLYPEIKCSVALQITGVRKMSMQTSWRILVNCFL